MTNIRFLYFGTLHPFSQLLLLAFVGLASMLFFFLLGSVLAVPLFGVDFGTVQADNENIAYLKFLQAFQSVGMFVAPAFVAALIFSEAENQRVRTYLCLKKTIDIKNVGLTVMLLLAALPVISVLGKINARLDLPESLNALEMSLKAMEETAEKLTKSFLITDSLLGLFVNLFIIALIPAVGEELFFRATVQRIFQSWFKNPHVAILAAAAVFSFIHFQFYGFFPRLVLGMMFGYLFFYTKNILYPIIAHFVNNAFGVTLYFFYDDIQKSALAGELDGSDTSLTFSEIGFAVLSLAIILIVLNRLRSQHKLSELNVPEIQS